MVSYGFRVVGLPHQLLTLPLASSHLSCASYSEAFPIASWGVYVFRGSANGTNFVRARVDVAWV